VYCPVAGFVVDGNTSDVRMSKACCIETMGYSPSKAALHSE
jgi:hypothetical protein